MKLFPVKPTLLLICATCLISSPRMARADEYHLAGASAGGLFALGLVVVDAGVTLANGFALANGSANRPNAYFGIGAAAVSYGLVAAAYAWSEEDTQRDQFAAIMGTAGTAALVTGLLALRDADRGDDASLSLAGAHISPTVISTGGDGPAVGLRLKIDF